MKRARQTDDSLLGKDFRIHESKAPLWFALQRPSARSKNICRTSVLLVTWQKGEHQTLTNIVAEDCVIENEKKLLNIEELM